MALTYAQQLKHPNWQRKRLEMLEDADWECEECGTKETTLHVHHKRYIKGRMAWEYERDELAVLCEDCHEEEHYIAKELNELLSHVNSTQALALVKGFHCTADWFDPWIGDAGRDRDGCTYAAGFLAFLVSGLPLEKMLLVAEYAITLANQNAEAPLQFEKHRYVFGED